MKKHSSAAQRKTHVARWRAGQRTQHAYAKSIGVSASTFCRWIHAQPATSTAPLAFVDVTPAPTADVLTVQIQRSGQSLCALQFDRPPSPAWFAAVLHEVSAC